jgi:hypothetical protein
MDTTTDTTIATELHRRARIYAEAVRELDRLEDAWATTARTPNDDILPILERLEEAVYRAHNAATARVASLGIALYAIGIPYRGPVGDDWDVLAGQPGGELVLVDADAGRVAPLEDFQRVVAASR